MPYSNCSSVKLAEGDTKVAIDNMAYWSKKYQHQTKKLAKAFTEKGLKETCAAFHSFLYNHFQYKIDGTNQNLRSPACSWSTRKVGIDCKSFSIIASTLLLNKNITHFLRRIKSGPGEGFSHVYVIVPKNQDQPYNLTDGYYVIDGTLSHTKEPVFYEKDDVYMEAKLPIYGLAGVLDAAQLLDGAQNQNGQSMQQAISSGLAKFINIAVDGLLNEIMGCDDAEYEFPIVKLRIERDLKEVLQKKIQDLDDAISYSNRPRIQSLFNDIFKELDLGIAHLRNETAYSQRDTCIGEILAAALNYISKIKDAFETFYNNFKKSFTRYKIEEFSKSAITTDRSLYFVVEIGSNPVNANYRYIVLRKEESNYAIEPILPYGELDETFEFTAGNWLLKNSSYLKNNYNDGRENNYKKAILPFIEKVKTLRKEVHLGGHALYLFEQPVQREMYKIWLKYDDKYTEFLKKEAQSLRTANELAMKDYNERFKKEIDKDKEVRKRKSLKKTMGIGALAMAGFLVIKNK